jgi:2-phospho-L-lactate guanylyltransferase (CobY/MobA/RfbA family)
VFRPSFGPDSLSRHVRLAEEAGLRFAVKEVPSLGHDVDTPDDLTALADALHEKRAVAPNTRGALRQLDRMQASRFGREIAPEALEV